MLTAGLKADQWVGSRAECSVACLVDQMVAWMAAMTVDSTADQRVALMADH